MRLSVRRSIRMNMVQSYGELEIPCMSPRLAMNVRCGRAKRLQQNCMESQERGNVGKALETSVVMRGMCGCII